MQPIASERNSVASYPFPVIICDPTHDTKDCIVKQYGGLPQNCNASNTSPQVKLGHLPCIHANQILINVGGGQIGVTV